MHNYRKKPVVIQALQFDGSFGSANQVLVWMGKEEMDPGGNWNGIIEIKTLEGTMRAGPRDWVIRGVQGEYYPCKPSIFESTYEDAAAGIGMVSKGFGDVNDPNLVDAPTRGFDIGFAVRWLREGRRVQRAGWNGKGMWLKLVETETYPAGNLCGHPFDNPMDVMAHICLYTADGKWQPGWNASTPDLLATDWQLVD